MLRVERVLMLALVLVKRAPTGTRVIAPILSAAPEAKRFDRRYPECRQPGKTGPATNTNPSTNTITHLKTT